MAEVVRRRSARILVVDDDLRVLLIHGFDPARPAVRYWFTPGGGINPSESEVDAAVRELREETGLEVSTSELGASVHHDVDVFSFEGRTYVQDQVFFLLRTPRFDAVPFALDDHEVRSVLRLAWWTLESLLSTTETVYPVGLVRLITGLTSGAQT